MRGEACDRLANIGEHAGVSPPYIHNLSAHTPSRHERTHTHTLTHSSLQWERERAYTYAGHRLGQPSSRRAWMTVLCATTAKQCAPNCTEKRRWFHYCLCCSNHRVWTLWELKPFIPNSLGFKQAFEKQKLRSEALVVPKFRILIFRWTEV